MNRPSPGTVAPSLRISAIAIIDCRRGIAANNTIPAPLVIQEDRRRFRQLTIGHALIMGRKTFATFSRPLPDRRNIILTQRHTRSAPAQTTFKNNLEDALEAARIHEQTLSPGDQQEVFIIGGGEIYTLAYPLLHRLYLTLVETDASCDTFFPDYTREFTKVITANTTCDLNHKMPTYTFVTLERPSS